jgi:hypothetical protein
MKNNITVMLYIISAILVIGGSLIFFAPKYLIRIGESLNREFGTKSKSKPFMMADEKVFLNRHIVGPTLAILGLVLIFITLYLL